MGIVGSFCWLKLGNVLVKKNIGSVVCVGCKRDTIAKTQLCANVLPISVSILNGAKATTPFWKEETFFRRDFFEIFAREWLACLYRGTAMNEREM
jgi:hypothetical protein